MQFTNTEDTKLNTEIQTSFECWAIGITTGPVSMLLILLWINSTQMHWLHTLKWRLLSCFLCKLAIMHCPFLYMFVEMGWRASGFFSDLDSPLLDQLLVDSPCLLLLYFTVLCLSPEARKRMLVSDKCSPTWIWSPSPVTSCSFSHCYYQ